ncbi:hypothetical protein [Lignipirellula cremea]|uniref:Uncharacterized protein n=1 Tax=Lignipirellula cremea TaxID=2528010 RepID=A0A518E3Y8_9BACT|nr:hypothetical protein [Lignipirellula cremea]QDU98798.1 hypothetical protein Pla8534_66720 [Lignipirellula cremea]
MLIGYETTKWQKIAEKEKEAKKSLSSQSAALVPRRLAQLAAFEDLGQISPRSAPLHLHLLTKERKGKSDRQGEFVIKLHDGDGIVFRPTGEYKKLADGTPNMDTVTQVEIVFIGNYHSKK